VGSDQALNFPTWREWRQVAALAEPAIVLRPPHDERTFAAACRQVFGDDANSWTARVLPIEPTDLSASAIRASLARGERPSGLDPAVAQHISERLLYRGG
jgi:nicotinate-nucleotide adenylyltransferase